MSYCVGCEGTAIHAQSRLVFGVISIKQNASPFTEPQQLFYRAIIGTCGIVASFEWPAY